MFCTCTTMSCHCEKSGTVSRRHIVFWEDTYILGPTHVTDDWSGSCGGLLQQLITRKIISNPGNYSVIIIANAGAVNETIVRHPFAVKEQMTLGVTPA